MIANQTLVLDASVIIKWLIPDPERETDSPSALAIMEGVMQGEIALLQPAHWLTEVSAVLTRLNPGTAEQDIEWLHAMELSVADTLEVYRRACKLAVQLNHHLFDTYYHAVALEHEETILVSADMKYVNKARPLGHIVALSEWLVKL